MMESKKQAAFCLDLMKRLYDDIKDSDDYHTRKQADITRLRRELLKLSELLDPWRP